MSSSTYMHGTSAEEQERLELMNGLLNRQALDLLDLRGNERILEMGAGTGIFAHAMASSLSGGRVLGIERDPEQIQGGSRRCAAVDNLELRRGDALDPPLTDDEWGSFDVVHARFLLEHVEDPLAVVRTMARAGKPGGRVVLVDDDHSLMRVWPEPEGFFDLWQGYVRQYDHLGMDAYVGRRLAALLHEAELTPSRTSLLFYGGASGELQFPAVIENLVGVFEGVSDRMIASGDLTREGYDAALANLKDWSRQPGSALWYGLPWAEGTVS
jgi:ubiquinone/menaquinone biosynthesis C-methylase UbiE